MGFQNPDDLPTEVPRLSTAHLRTDVNSLAKNLRHRSIQAISTAHRVNKTIVREIQKEVQTAKAEADEFIQSPHLLFRPLRMFAILGVPLAIPLFFMPLQTLLAYVIFCLSWYLICFCYFATEVAMRPPWYKPGLSMMALPPYWKGYFHDPKVSLGLNFHDVEFQNASGETLRGWAIRSRVVSENDWVVCVHGAGRDRRAFLRHAEAFETSGLSVLLFDTSEHGLSGHSSAELGRGTSFGVREQFDVIAAVDFVKRKYAANKVAIVGTSAGASSAILAAAWRQDLAHAVVAENPFTRPDALFRFHLSNLAENYLSENRHRTGRRLLFWFASRVLMVRIGQYAKSFGALDAAPQLSCPLLIAHSTTDNIVPFCHGLSIYNAALNAKKAQANMVSMYKVEDCAHCALFDKDPEEWSNTVISFIRSSFSAAQKADR